MDENQMIEDLVRMLDADMANGVGHINVDTDEKLNLSVYPTQAPIPSSAKKGREALYM